MLCLAQSSDVLGQPHPWPRLPPLHDLPDLKSWRTHQLACRQVQCRYLAGRGGPQNYSHPDRTATCSSPGPVFTQARNHLLELCLHLDIECPNILSFFVPARWISFHTEKCAMCTSLLSRESRSRQDHSSSRPRLLTAHFDASSPSPTHRYI